MREVDRACHGCLYSGDDEVYVKPEKPGLTHLNDAHTEYETTDQPCDICGKTPSLKKT